MKSIWQLLGLSPYAPSSVSSSRRRYWKSEAHRRNHNRLEAKKAKKEKVRRKMAKRSRRINRRRK